MRHIRMLISDIDNTLLGDEVATERFRQWFDGLAGSVRLAYASGRQYDSVVASLRATRLPEPHAVIAAVGSEIRRHPGGQPLEGWTAALGSRWDAAAIREALADHPRLDPQPESEQTEVKVSYYLRDAKPDELAALQRELEHSGFDVQLVYSSARDLDILPKGASKGTAAAYLAYAWNIPPEQVVVAGDSGNDRSLFDHSFRGVIVANAQPELAGVRHPLVYHARKPYADGVLEGIGYWTGDHSAG